VLDRLLGFAASARARPVRLFHRHRRLVGVQDRGAGRFRGNARYGSPILRVARAPGVLDRLHHQRRLVRVQDEGESDHPVIEVLLSQRPVLVQPVSFRRDRDGPAQSPAQTLELGARAETRGRKQVLLVRRRGDPGQRTHLAIGERSLPEGIVDQRKPPQRQRHPHPLARHCRPKSDAPTQPVCTAHQPLPPPLPRLIERPDAGQQPMRGRVDVGSRASNLVAKCLGVSRNREHDILYIRLVVATISTSFSRVTSASRVPEI
jgi:hypothetical protein